MYTDEATLNYTIRNMTMADIEAVVDFYHELEAAEPMGHQISVASFTAMCQQASNRFYTRLLAHLTNAEGGVGKLVGYGFILKSDDDEIAQLRVHVLPAWRKRGIGSRIYQQLEQAALAQGANKMISEADERATLTPPFLSKRGFVRDHATLTMRLPTEQEIGELQLANGYTMRHFMPGDEEALRRVSLTAFAGFKDYFASDTEQAVAETQEPDFDPARFIFVCAGDEVVGYCQAEVELDEGKGWIDNLGVVPLHRRVGLGRALLLAGINYIRQFVPIVFLGVEDYNDKALPLYYTVGFQKHRAAVAMIRDLTV